MLFAITAMPANAWFFDNDHPSKAEVLTLIEQDLPQHIKIKEVKIRSQETREALFEYSETRVRVMLSSSEPLFNQGEKLVDGSPLIYRVDPPKEGIVLFALVEAKATGEGWEGHVVWDKKRAIKGLRRTRATFGDAAIEKWSDDHLDRLELFKQQQIAISGTFQGMATCGYSFFEIDTLSVDAVNGVGDLIYRKVGPAHREWNELDMKVSRARIGVARTGVQFIADGKDWRISVELQDDELVFGGQCEMDIYEKGSVPKDIQAHRAQRQEMIDSLSPGPIESKANFGSKALDFRVEVLDVHENGFQLGITHPVFLNSQFNTKNRKRCLKGTLPAPALAAR